MVWHLAYAPMTIMADRSHPAVHQPCCSAFTALRMYCGRLAQAFRGYRACPQHLFLRRTRARWLLFIESVCGQVRFVQYEEHLKPNTEVRLARFFYNASAYRWLQRTSLNTHRITRGMALRIITSLGEVEVLMQQLWIGYSRVFFTAHDRVRYAALLLTLAYFGPRPFDLVEKMGALCYRDLELRLILYGGSKLLTLSIILESPPLENAADREPGRRIILTVWENRECPILCPLIFYFALALYNGVFYSPRAENLY